MHYEINQVNGKKETDDIIVSYRRAGNEAGWTQAKVAARQLGKQNPENSVFVYKVTSQTERELVAGYNIDGDIPNVERLNHRFKTLQAAYNKAIASLTKDGMTTAQAHKELHTELIENHTS